MAAGFVNHNITTAVSVTYALRQWALDTGSPDANVFPAYLLTDGSNIITLAQNALGTNDWAVPVMIHPDCQQGLGQEAMVDSSSVAVASDQSAVAVALDTSKMTEGNSGATLTPKFHNFAVSSSGNQQILAGVTSKKIRVLAYSLQVQADTDVTARWVKDTGGTPGNISGKKRLVNDGDAFIQGFNPLGWFETTAGHNLGLNLSAAVEVSGELTYVEVA